MSNRLRDHVDTLLWLGAAVVALVVAPLLLLAGAVLGPVDRAGRAVGGAR